MWHCPPVLVTGVFLFQSNWINGVIYEDFSCDLRDEEELESEDDFDSLLAVCVAAASLPAQGGWFLHSAD